MSLSAEEIARRESELMESPGNIIIRVPVSWDSGICRPCESGDYEEKAIFRELTFGDYMILEKACTYETDRGDGKMMSLIDHNEKRRLSVKRNLLSWSLDVPIDRQNGWLTKDCYERVGMVSAPLVDAFLDGFWGFSDVTADEEATMSKQASVLFGPNSRGVTDACEGVRLYCTMSAFAEKFNISRNDLPNLPYKEYLMLKIMGSYEVEWRKRDSKRPNHGGTKIAGPGGRTRVAQGKRIPL